MGMYTEILVNTNFKKSVPEDVLGVIRAMCDGDFDGIIRDHFPKRWTYLFYDNSYYTPSTECARLTYDAVSGRHSLLAKGDIKNYDGEIEAFFEFIKPWCANDFIGYYRYEEDREPTLVYSGYEEDGDDD